MFRDSEPPERTSDVAAVIAEEGLRYVSDATPGFTRRRTGTSFSYWDKDGKRIASKDIVRRIKSIGIPPAYERVWICPIANGHIQATGPRCPRSQAVSLSSQMARASRPDQI